MSKKINDGMTAKQRYDLKRKTVGINLSLEQYADLNTRAERRGMTITEYVRYCIDQMKEWENENS